MNRRQLLAAAAAAAFPGAALAAVRTRWRISLSEGMDALCFLGPLSGDPFYTRYYEAELAAFRPRLSGDVLAAVAGLKQRAGLSGPVAGYLTLMFSGGPHGSVESLLWSLDNAEHVLRPPLRASPYWSAGGWSTLLDIRPGLRGILSALQGADFPAFRGEMVGAKAARRASELALRLRGVDVIAEQERLIGRRLDPELEVILLQFSQPHGIKIIGQRYITYLDYPDSYVIRNAAHEILHPPFDPKGPHARAAMAVLGRDPLIRRIVVEGPGYNTLGGYLDENFVEALKQIVNERLGVAPEPAKHWTESDAGMNVLAAGLYGLLKADEFDRNGGVAELWLGRAARSGRLAPASLHAAAARVLRRPQDRLWPLRLSQSLTSSSGSRSERRARASDPP